MKFGVLEKLEFSVAEVSKGFELRTEAGLALCRDV